MKTDVKLKLEIDSHYTDEEIKELGLKSLNGHNLDYLIFEKNNQVYFFERVKKNILRLFCCTSRKSFYLS